GMGRLGCAPQRAASIAREIRRSPHLLLDGVATHLASPGPDGAKETERQVARFRKVLDDLKAEGIEAPWRHAYGSGGRLSLPAGEVNLVRPGLAVYGSAPAPGAPAGPALEPALPRKPQGGFLRGRRRG